MKCINLLELVDHIQHPCDKQVRTMESYAVNLLTGHATPKDVFLIKKSPMRIGIQGFHQATQGGRVFFIER